MVRYEKCPRCDLNYIDPDKQEFCDVCIAEMRGNKLQFADLEEEDYEELDAELEQGEICPVCGVNRMRAGEQMCESCRDRQEYEDDADVDIDKDEEWKNYLEEDEGDITVDDEALQEEIEEEFGDDEEEEDYGEEEDPLSALDDDFDDDFDDDDFDDEDEDDEDDEDGDDDDF